MYSLEVFVGGQASSTYQSGKAVFSLEVFIRGGGSSTYQSGKAVFSLEVVNEGWSELYVII